LANLRQRPSQEKVRSTTQRLGNTSKPLAVSERLTISVSRPGKAFFGRCEIAVLDNLHRRRAFGESAAVSVLNVGGMHDGVQQQAYRIDENMPLLAFDLLARIVAMRVDASPVMDGPPLIPAAMYARLGQGAKERSNAKE
jgi:hypothetical protein